MCFLRLTLALRVCVHVGGECSAASERALLKRSGAEAKAAFAQDGILPTTLLTRKDEVDALNAAQLAKLPGAVSEYKASDSGNAEVAEQACPARRLLRLKVGAQVILLRNVSVEMGLCNGSRGVGGSFRGPLRHPVVKFASGKSHGVEPRRGRCASAAPCWRPARRSRSTSPGASRCINLRA